VIGPADVIDRLDGLLALARPGESIEVFVRQVRTGMISVRPDAGRRVQRADQCFAEIRAGDVGTFGSAVATSLGASAIGTALTMARELHRLAPIVRVERGPMPPLRYSSVDHDRDLRMADVRSVVDAARELADGAVVTGSDTVRSVVLVDTAGRRGGYVGGEAQLHLRSGAAQGGALALTPAALDLTAAGNELSTARARLAGPRTTLGRTDWVVLAPMATARLLSHLGRSLYRTGNAGQRPPEESTRVGSAAVTIVDDGTLPDGPGNSPFDDDGVPTGRTVVVRKGEVTALLGGLPLATSTGNARRSESRQSGEVAPTNLFLEPTRSNRWTPSERRGTGLYVDQVSGLGGQIDLHHARLQLTLTGQAVRNGRPDGTASVVLAGTAREILGAVTDVAGTNRFYRIQGVFGGAECLLEGVDARGA